MKWYEIKIKHCSTTRVVYLHSFHRDSQHSFLQESVRYTLRLAMIFALRLGQRTHFMMLNPAHFILVANKSNVLTLPNRKECCQTLQSSCHHHKVSILEGNFKYYSEFSTKHNQICPLEKLNWTEHHYSKVKTTLANQ